jgi:hypothetical protein
MSDLPRYVAPAAWYMDPYGSDQLRWWDGARWTEHLAPVPASVAAAAAAGTAAPAATPAAEAEPAELPPAEPVGRYVPIAADTGYTWDDETSRREEPEMRPWALGRTTSSAEEEVQLVPGRAVTASSILLALSPLFAIAALAASLLYRGFELTGWWTIAAVAAPLLLGVVLAALDSRRLKRWRYTRRAPWALALLTPLVYLPARTAVVRRESGTGLAPLLLFFVFLLLGVGGSVGAVVATNGHFVPVLAEQVEAKIAAGSSLTADCPVILPTLAAGSSFTCQIEGASPFVPSSRKALVVLESGNGTDFSYVLQK